MRDREEILEQFTNMFGKGPSALKELLMLEVLLDIRELLTKTKK